MPEPLTSIAQVTSTWLTQALRENGHLDRGTVVAVRPVDQETTGGPGFHPSHRLQVRYSTDAPPSAPARLYVKMCDGAFDKLAGQQEVTFYTSIAASMPHPPAARCYHATYDPETGAYHLLLADASETHRTVHPEGPATQPDTEHMLDALARLHAHWWGHPRLGQDIGGLPTVASIRGDFDRLVGAFPGYVDFLADRLSVERRQVYEQVLDRFPTALTQRLADRDNLTVIHYDAHAGNFLLPREPDEKGGYIVDWEQWGVQVGPRDVAYLIALFWYPERRARLEEPLVRHYHDLLLKYGVIAYDWQACWRDYRLFAIENLLVPFWAWVDRIWDERRGYHRWHQLEKAMLAFQDLGCENLLRG